MLRPLSQFCGLIVTLSLFMAMPLKLLGSSPLKFAAVESDYYIQLIIKCNFGFPYEPAASTVGNKLAQINLISIDGEHSTIVLS